MVEKQCDEGANETDVDILKNSEKRHQIIEKVPLKVNTKMTFNKVFQDFRKDSELLQITKFVQHLLLKKGLDVTGSSDTSAATKAQSSSSYHPPSARQHIPHATNPSTKQSTGQDA